MFLKSSGSCRLVNLFVRGGTNRGRFDGAEPKPVLGFQISAMKSTPKPPVFLRCLRSCWRLLPRREPAHSRSKGGF